MATKTYFVRFFLFELNSSSNFYTNFQVINVSSSKDIDHRWKKTNPRELYLPTKPSIIKFDQIPSHGGHRFGYRAFSIKNNLNYQKKKKIGLSWKNAATWSLPAPLLLKVGTLGNSRILFIVNFAMTEWFCYVTCFAKTFLLLLFHNTHQVRCYHFFIVEIIVESVNLIQMSN